MNRKLPYYAVCFAHGQLNSRQKLKKVDRYTNPTAVRQVDKGYIPIFMFGTHKAITQYSKTIVCFHVFCTVFGTDFAHAVADALIKYGDHYMQRYKLPANSTIMQKAIYYMFQLNKEEIEKLPQNRFYTYIQDSQQPYDISFSTNENNETAISTFSFPTLKFPTTGGQKYFTICDFTYHSNWTMEQFPAAASQKFVTPQGHPLIPEDVLLPLLGEDYVQLVSSDNTQYAPLYDDYEVEFGICRVKNIFSIIQMGLYATIDTNYISENQGLYNVLNIGRDLKFSTVVSDFANFDVGTLMPNNNNQEYECRGIFTFCCRSPAEGFLQQGQTLQIQQHQTHGLIPYSQQQILQMQQQQRKQQIKKQNARLVKDAMKKSR